MSKLEARMNELTAGNAIDTTTMLGMIGDARETGATGDGGHTPVQQPDLESRPSLA